MAQGQFVNPSRRLVSFVLSVLLAAGPPSEAVAASYVFRQATGAGTYPIPTITNNVVTNASYYKLDGKTYSISWQGSGGVQPYAMSLVAGTLPPGCPAPEQTGTILISNCVFTAEGNYGGIVAQLTDANGMVVRDNAPAITVTAPPPTLGFYNFPFSGYVGKAYSGTARVTGGRPPYVVSRATGTLPPGLALSTGTDANGNQTVAMSGTPTAIGSYTFDFLVADANQKSVTSSKINISVSYGPVSLTLLPSKIARTFKAVVGSPIRNAGVAVSGGTPPSVLTLLTGTLPPGLRLAQDGSITGTPTSSGTFSAMQIKAVDSASPTPTTATSPSFSIDVSSAIEAVVAGGNDTYTVGRPIASLPTVVTGGTPPYTYALEGAPPPGLVFSPGRGTITGTPTQAGRYGDLAVTATDADGNQGTSRAFTMAVSDPVAVTGSAHRGTVGTPYVANFAASGGLQPYAFTIAAGTLPAGLDLARNGAIAGTPTTAGRSENVVVRATDAAGASADTSPFPIVVGDALSIASTPGGSATRGVPYDARVVPAGGTAPYAFAIVSGSPAPGIAMDATGRFAGTPTTVGDFGPTTVLVTDAEGGRVSTDVSIPVVDQLAVAGLLSPATVGQAYAATFQASGGNAPYAFDLAGGPLPDGVVLDGATGAVAGAPTSAGSWSGIVVRARDAAGRTATSPQATLVVSGSLRISGSPGSAATVGQSYSSGFAAMGGRPPYAFSVSSGTPPSGIVLDASSGTLAGTPSAAGIASGLRIRVADADARTAVTDPFAITVSDILQVSGSPSESAVVGTAYTAEFATFGGRGPFAWSLDAGTLPAGLALGSDGRLAGAPTTPGTSSSIQIAATDADGRRSSSAPFSITVASSLSVAGSPPPSATAGVAYDAKFVAKGGTGAKRFGLAFGELPASLSLDPETGSLYGTPSVPGVVSGLVVRATDAVGTTSDSSPFSIDVRPPLAIMSLPAATASVGTAYASAATASGGRSPYVWTLRSGVAPAGLILDGSTGAIAGTPTTPGTAALRLQVVDADGRLAISDVFDLAVASTLSISGSPAARGTVGIAYSATFAASGGYGARSFSLAAGMLPAGLTLTSGGTLAGTPSTVGTSTGLVVRTTDASGTFADAAPFTIDVRAPLAVSMPVQVYQPVGTTFNVVPTITGGTGPYTATLVGPYPLPAGLTFNSTTGAITGTPTVATSGPQFFSVRIVDALKAVATSNVSYIYPYTPLGIVNVPPSTIGLYRPLNGGSGVINFQVVGNGLYPYAFSMIGSLPPGLSLDASTGALTGIPNVAGNYPGLQVRVVSKEGNVGYSPTFAMRVSPALAITASTPANAPLGVSYAASFSASGGVGSYTYALDSGTLPPGLTLSSTTGQISGKPTTSGSYTGLSVRVSDAESYRATSATFAIKVPDPLAASFTPPPATVGATYSATVPATGGVLPYTFVSLGASLPNGLSIDPSTGAIAGTPGGSGDSGGIYFKVTDATGSSVVTTSTTISVRNPVVPTVPSYKTRLGVAYKSTLDATGGKSPFIFSLTGTLPAGLSFDPSTGIIGGTPTTIGTASGLILKATDSSGRTGSSAVYFETVGPIAVTSGALPTAVVNQPYSFQMTATGGRAPLYWGVYGGALPLGMTIDRNTGVVSGTPTNSGSWAGVDVRARDPDGYDGAIVFNLLVVNTLTAVTPAPAAATQGRSFTHGLAANGGRSPYTWTVAAGSLPAGLSIIGTAISGTPSGPGVASGIKLQVRDAEGRTATTNGFSIVVQ